MELQLWLLKMLAPVYVLVLSFVAMGTQCFLFRVTSLSIYCIVRRTSQLTTQKHKRMYCFNTRTHVLKNWRKGSGGEKKSFVGDFVVFSKLFLIFQLFFLFGATAPQWARASSLSRFLDHTQRRTTVSRTSLDECSARRRDLYLTTRNNHNRYSCPRWDSNPNLNRRAVADLHLRPRGHWDPCTAGGYQCFWRISTSSMS